MESFKAIEETKEKIKRYFAGYQESRSHIEKALDLTHVQCSDNTKNPLHIKYPTQINPLTGRFNYNPSNFDITYFHRNESELIEYYDKVRALSTEPHLGNVKTTLEEWNRQDQTPSHNVFYTTYTFTPIGPFKNVKLTQNYSMIRQDDDYKAATQSKLEIHGNNVCPVVGYLLNHKQKESIIGTLHPHAMHCVFMDHVLHTLQFMSWHVKSELHKKFELTRGMSLNQLNNPEIVTTKKPPLVICTGFHEITKYVTTHKATLKFGNDDDGVYWHELSHNMLLLAQQLDQRYPSYDKHENHKVNSLEMNIHVTTFCSRPLYIPTGDEGLFEYTKKKSAPKTIIGQYITVGGSYKGSSANIAQPHSVVQFVTTNRGLNKWISRDENLKAVMFMFGYGAPLQAEIKDIVKLRPIKSFFGSDHPNIDSEHMTSSIALAVNELTKQPFGNSVEMSFDLPYVKESKGEGQQVVDMNDKTNKIYEIIRHSLSKNFEKKRSSDKQSNPNKPPPYHHASDGRRMFCFLVMGHPFVDSTFKERAFSVTLFMPQGKLGAKCNLPEWDNIQYNVMQMIPHWNVLNPAGDGAPQYNMGILENNGQPMDKKLPTNQKQSVYVDEEISIDSILQSASHPSVFDDEVYM